VEGVLADSLLKGFLMSKDKTSQIEPEVQTVPAKKKERMVRVFAEESFVDGNLRQFFEQYGYDVFWPMNEVREIPEWLYIRCVNSGGTFTNADD